VGEVSEEAIAAMRVRVTETLRADEAARLEKLRELYPKIWEGIMEDRALREANREMDRRFPTELVGHWALEKSFVEYFDKHPDADEGLMRACMLVWATSALERATRADLADVEFLAEVMRRVQCKAMNTLAAAKKRKARRELRALAKGPQAVEVAP
jgi:hypothetical protein